MSEEEKESFEELKKEINKPLEVPEDKCNTFILYNIDNAKIIVNLIEKQKKEIEELKKDNIHQWEERCRLTFDIEKNFVSKDKIREKISILEKIQSEFKDNELLRIKIITLKELLLEEE